jgi:hypothetical protein
MRGPIRLVPNWTSLFLHATSTTTFDLRLKASFFELASVSAHFIHTRDFNHLYERPKDIVTAQTPELLSHRPLQSRHDECPCIQGAVPQDLRETED